ncbi:MAG: Tex-like N-terminal domain-containing protein, partial [Peptostreptococcaceae bacterium]
MDINQILKAEFNLKDEHINNTIKLIDEGNTIPFIARYRKEMT